jgi:hypothetical protein
MNSHVPLLPEVLNVNGKLYGLCNACFRVVRVNKPFFGSMHRCLSAEERKRFNEEQERAAAPQYKR